MKQSPLAKGLTAIAVLGMLLAAFMVNPPAASAAPPANTKIIAAAGSDTTEEFMNVLLANPGPNTASDNGLYNIKAKYTAPASLFVPADTAPVPAECTDLTWTALPADPNPATEVAPDGSGAGLNKMRDFLDGTAPQGEGCIDIARSSSGPRTICGTGNCDPATFEYYAFGLDAVAVASPSLNAPAVLSKAQVKDIYDCDVTDWAQVGGSPGAIQRYLPQAGSGTRSFFLAQWLDNPAIPLPTAANCPAVKDVGIQENTGKAIVAADFQTAIIPYSAGNWINQANVTLNPTLDLRNQTRLINQRPEATFNADTTAASTTLTTALTNRFTAVNVGGTVTGAGIPANTTITAVAANGQTATLSNPATATASGVSVTLVSLANGTARWLTTGSGRWLPNAPNASNLRAPIREVEESINNSLRDYVGVRYVYNVVDSTAPMYSEARGIIGFNNVAAGAKSPLCDAGKTVEVSNAGFQPLPAANPADISGASNLAGATCRRFS